MTVYDADIIERILLESGITPTDLAGRLGVSTRTLRDRIHRVNESLDGVARVHFSRSRGGYVLDVTDHAAFEAWRERLRALSQDDPASSADSRCAYLLNDLLLRNDWITLDSLAEMLFVSRACISGDLKRIEPVLTHNNLSLEKRPRYGIRVTGSEMGRRLCLAEATVRRMTKRDEAGDTFDRAFEPLLDAVSTCVDEVLERESFAVNSLSYQNLLVHIAIAVLRIRGGNAMPQGSLPASAAAGTRERAVAERIAEAVARDLDVTLPSSEIGYIAIHLAGKRVLYEDQVSQESTIITDEMWDLVGRMIDVVWRVYRFDFRDDVELRMNLARHMVPLSVRLTYHMHLENPLLDDIKSRFPLAYSMAGEAACVLADSYGYYPSEHELGYIAMAFALALERQRTEQAHKRILVVCASGMASARLLAFRIKEEFGGKLGSIRTCNAAEVADQDFDEIDYVFTTVPLSVAVPVPVREITLLLTDADRELMRNVLEGAPDDLAAYFPRDLFFTHRRFASKEEAISFLCDELRRARPDEVPETFEELVWRREEAAPTSFGNDVALPHPLEAVSTSTFAAVALLDEPLEWGTGTVRAIFMLSISRLPEAKLDGFYRPVARLLNDGDAIARLVHAQTYDQLMAELSA